MDKRNSQKGEAGDDWKSGKNQISIEVRTFVD